MRRSLKLDLQINKPNILQYSLILSLNLKKKRFKIKKDNLQVTLVNDDGQNEDRYKDAMFLRLTYLLPLLNVSCMILKSLHTYMYINFTFFLIIITCYQVNRLMKSDTKYLIMCFMTVMLSLYRKS